MKILSLFSNPKFAVESPSARRQSDPNADIKELIRNLRHEIRLNDQFEDML
jgi:hypothetical protein